MKSERPTTRRANGCAPELMSSPTKRKILLVGGAGYVGSVLTGHLLDAGYRVRCLDLLLYDNAHGVMPFQSRNNYEFLFGDFTDPEIIRESLQEITDVVLLAGLVGDPITQRYPEESQAINEAGLRKLIHSLNGWGLRRVVFLSTCSNYGFIPRDQLADEDYELKPLSLYSKAKVAVEREILSPQGKCDYSPTILRLATAFGLAPRMRFDLTVNEFTRDLFQGKELIVYDADTWRPYCHVKDIARAVTLVLETSQVRVASQIFNTGGDRNNYTKRMIVDQIHQRIPHAWVRYQEGGSDARNYRVDFTKIREQINFEPHYSVGDGIREILDALKQNEFPKEIQNENHYGNYTLSYPKSLAIPK